MEKYLILIMGPQGSGKGTQGKLLADKFHYVYAEMGPTLSEYAKLNLEDGQIIKQHQQKGLLVPDEVVIRAIKYRFEGSTSIILDGVPRNKEQAEEIINLAQEYGLKTIAIYIDLDDNEAIKRLLARKICPIDGYEPPYPQSLKKTTCDKCGVKLIRRSDDTKKVIRQRLSEYHKKTKPMIDFLKKKKIVVLEIDGKPSVEKVKDQIMTQLKEQGIIDAKNI